MAQFHTYQCSRLLGVQLTYNDVSMLFISVYMPYQCDDNFEIKNKSGNISDKSNYRPIALVTTCSKIFESCLLKMLEHYLQTHDHQLRFKSQHATDMCIFTVKNVIKYYTKQTSTVFTCFLDAAKAFDRVSHWTLFSKMIKKNILIVIVRVIAFWYQT